MGRGRGGSVVPPPQPPSGAPGGGLVGGDVVRGEEWMRDGEAGLFEVVDLATVASVCR